MSATRRSLVIAIWLLCAGAALAGRVTVTETQDALVLANGLVEYEFSVSDSYDLTALRLGEGEDSLPLTGAHFLYLEPCAWS